ncbi:hypothetical protein, partial [Mycobacterium sp. E1747]|uniref:hypothetical protein n=1 Tax=Mycobacterium sp. E1747 TaxID=1834128 RepID=UPI001E42733A
CVNSPGVWPNLLQRVDMNNRRGTSYHTAHRVVKNQRGNASEHRCVDCGKPAQQWSYDHTDANAIIDARGREYSFEPHRYQPRCVACHLNFDAEYRRSGIPQLHAVAAELEPQIREALRERREAVKRYDLAAVDKWDDELERLTAPLHVNESRGFGEKAKQV